MKKILLISVLSAGSFMFAQTKPASPVTFGAKAGLNISFLGGASKAGFYGGGFVNIPVSSKLSIQPEILYNGLGAKSVIVPTVAEAASNPGNNDDVKLSLNYISVPVMAQYHISPGFYVEAGPQISFLIDSEVKYRSVSIDGKKALDLRSIDYGVGAGAGYYFTSGIGIQARYMAGIGNISAGGPTNSVIQIGLAYKFK
ncbi:porin family protein [Chryseobacterium gossypii]|uniref:porin family protein n=1 Tax=Chryseobacterium gossypii TaxID=3231602 RepID=UPI0035238523